MFIRTHLDNKKLNFTTSYKMQSFIPFAVVLSVSVAMTSASVQSQDLYQLEDAISGTISFRSEAIGGETLRVVDTTGKTFLNVELCLTPKESGDITIKVDDIRYSNDGDADTITIKQSNNVVVGSFTTVAASNNGHLWNVFRNSGPIGNQMTFSGGTHYLKIYIQTDTYGVELDSLRLNADNQKEALDFICEVTVSSD